MHAFQREPELGIMQEGVGVCVLVGAGWGEGSVQTLAVLEAVTASSIAWYFNPQYK